MKINFIVQILVCGQILSSFLSENYRGYCENNRGYCTPVVGGCDPGVEDEDSDHLLAMSLQRQDDEAGHRDQEWQQFKQQNLGPDGTPLSE